MNSQETFLLLLQHGIGLTQGRQRTAITTHGYDTCRGLVDTSNDGIKTVFETIARSNRGLNQAQQVTIREQVKQRIYGTRSELIMRLSCGAPITDNYLSNLTTETVDGFVQKHNQWKVFKEAASNMTLPSVTIPLLTKSNWKEFSQAMKELLTRHRGTYSVPLIYVIRQNTIGNYDDGTYLSTEEQLSTCLAFNGGNYQSDNSTVWSLLSEHTTGTEAESIVQRFSTRRNGRSAWLALIAHMESTSYLDNLKSSAMANIAAATYTGEKKNFGIAKYFTIHSNAHNDLATSGEPLTNGMKITHFLQGLKDDTAMNFAIATKSEANVNSFEEFYNSFSSKLTTKLTLTQQIISGGSQRQISAIDSSSSSKDRGYYRGHGGRRGGRGGRGRRGGGKYNSRGGRGYGRSNRFNPTGQSWKPRLGEYSNEEWSKLSYNQKQRVFDLRSATTTQPSGDGHRTISQIGTEDGSIPSQVQLPPTPGTQMVQQPSDSSARSNSRSGRQGRAGDAFSHGQRSNN